MAKRELISREEALSYPFANGKYDHKNANINFILGHESYKEWLETLPVFTEQDIVKSVLEKIRAEIEQKLEQEEFARSVFRHEEKDCTKAEQCTGSIMAYRNVLKMFDKYKAESKEEPPTVDAQPVIHAKWIFRSGAVYDEYICSNCNKRHIDYATNYCPNCGAKMESEDEE